MAWVQRRRFLALVAVLVIAGILALELVPAWLSSVPSPSQPLPTSRGDFAMSAEPSSPVVAPGTYGRVKISVVSEGGFAGSVTVTDNLGFPTSTYDKLVTLSRGGTAYSVVLFFVDVGTPPGTYNGTITTSGENVSHSTTISIVVPSGISYSVTTDAASYVHGQLVSAELRVTNAGPWPVTYVLADSCYRFGFIIYSSKGLVVYSNVPPADVACLQIYNELTIQPGETITAARLGWDQQVEGGVYTITGVFHYQFPYRTIAFAHRPVTILV